MIARILNALGLVKAVYLQDAKLQLQDGDIVLHCGHLPIEARSHWFTLKEPSEFTAPDGTKGMSRWLLLCDACFQTHSECPWDSIYGHIVWKGTDPIIREVSRT